MTRLSDADLAALPGASRVMRDGAAAEVLSTAAEATVRALLERDAELYDLTVVDAGLEEAFLALTDAPSTPARATSLEIRHG